MLKNVLKNGYLLLGNDYHTRALCYTGSQSRTTMIKTGTLADLFARRRFIVVPVAFHYLLVFAECQ